MSSSGCVCCTNIQKLSEELPAISDSELYKKVKNVYNATTFISFGPMEKIKEDINFKELSKTYKKRMENFFNSDVDHIALVDEGYLNTDTFCIVGYKNQDDYCVAYHQKRRFSKYIKGSGIKFKLV
jgi:hypothetical protein